MSRWTEKEIKILKSSYHIKRKNDLCKMLINKNWTAIKDKAFRLKLSYFSNNHDETRFWKYVDKKSKNECWNWTGTCDQNGYGQFWPYHQKAIGTHRFSWLLHYGDIPDQLWVLHTCDNRKCINPQHLWLGTRQDNMKDMVIKNRQIKCEKHPRAKLTVSQVERILELKGKFSHRELAGMFNVSHTSIGKIHRSQSWRNRNDTEGSDVWQKGKC